MGVLDNGLQHILRVFTTIATAGESPTEALRVKYVQLPRQLGVIHPRVSTRAVYGYGCVERGGHMTHYVKARGKSR